MVYYDDYPCSFFKLPKFLWEDDELRVLSPASKILYAAILDRASLSKKNGWIDRKGLIYVICSQREMAETLGCSEKSVRKCFKELENSKLIERRKRGLSMPDMIYPRFVF